MKLNKSQKTFMIETLRNAITDAWEAGSDARKERAKVLDGTLAKKMEEVNKLLVGKKVTVKSINILGNITEVEWPKTIQKSVEQKLKELEHLRSEHKRVRKSYVSTYEHPKLEELKHALELGDLEGTNITELFNKLLKEVKAGK